MSDTGSFPDHEEIQWSVESVDPVVEGAPPATRWQRLNILLSRVDPQERASFVFRGEEPSSKDTSVGGADLGGGIAP
jgi:hypothetical protein